MYLMEKSPIGIHIGCLINGKVIIAMIFQLDSSVDKTVQSEEFVDYVTATTNEWQSQNC